ncbi:retrovirus-related pol polyprotein from transposon TNT 1-94, partial [Tanacetum coccineum]
RLKMVTFHVDLYHDGYFVSNLLQYMYGEHRLISDLKFEDDNLCEDKSDSDFKDVEKNDSLEDLKDVVDFQTEGEDNVVIPKLSTNDPWLNKLVGKGKFVGEMENPTPDLHGRFMVEENDPDEKYIYPKYKVKRTFNILPLSLIPYGMSLLYMQNDLLKMLVKCGRDVDAGKCTGNRGKKQQPKDQIVPTKYAGNKGKEQVGVKGKEQVGEKARNLDHYNRLWQYRHAVLDSNPGSTCRMDLEERDDGLIYFKIWYVCFLGLKAGWQDGCRKVIWLDGYFLTHTCKGQLLTAMGRDANNQMFPIAWVVVGVEKKNNLCWFLALLSRDLNLNDGRRLPIIINGHKCTAVVEDPKPSTNDSKAQTLKEFIIKFTVMNDKKWAPVRRTPVLKTSFHVAWRILLTFVVQDQKFRSTLNVLSQSNITNDPSKVTLIELTASMIAVNNLESLVTPLSYYVNKGKKESQTVSQPKLKIQGLEASGALPQKRKNP